MVPTLLFVALTVGRGLCAAAVLGQPRPHSTTPGFPVSPLLFLVPIVALMVLRILRDPLRTSIGFFILLLGVPVSGWVLARQAGAARSLSTPRHPEIVLS